MLRVLVMAFVLAGLATLTGRGSPAPASTGTATLFNSKGSEALQQSFLNAYLKYNEGEQEEAKGNVKQARVDYKVALQTLHDIAAADPKWESVMLARCEDDSRAALARLDSAGSGSGHRHRVALPSSDGTLFTSEQSLDECYLAAYVKLCEASQAQKQGSTRAAITDYKVTLNTLMDIQKADPSWETALVDHRIADCRSAIAQLEDK
jgi:hypothetical protein